MTDVAKTVLIVDDTPTNIALLVDTLRPEYRTKVATSGEKALVLAQGANPPDLILLDIMMPGLDGYQVCQRLQADPKTRDIPIIFVTALGEVADEEKGLLIGARDYIIKPISPAIVRARVRTHLTLAEQNRRLAEMVSTLEQQKLELAEWNQTLEQRVTEGIAHAERLRQIAFHDALTGLANRMLLLDRLEHALDLAARDQQGLGLMFIDLDRFKAVNDTHGHDVGDELLKEVARRLGQCRRASDTVARLGGDEFVVLLEHSGEKNVYGDLAARIIASLSEPLTIMGCPVQIGASIGIACYPEDGQNLMDLMKHADAAMYAAKSAGRGAYRFFDPAMSNESLQLQKQAQELQAAMENGQLELFYQPQVWLDSGRVFRLEGLLRWRHPVHGLLLPIEFISSAEDAGLSHALDHWAIATAAQQISQWRSRGLPRLPIAVNVSGRQWDDLPEYISSVLQRHPFALGALELELSEHTVMADFDSSQKLLTRLKSLGVPVTLDNFGTAYSNLSQLGLLPLHALKIHRTFVLGPNFEASPAGGDAQAVRSILALGQGLGITVLAEGIETASQASLLRYMGCVAGQGYHYARPMPANETGEWLLSQGAE